MENGRLARPAEMKIRRNWRPLRVHSPRRPGLVHFDDFGIFRTHMTRPTWMGCSAVVRVVALLQQLATNLKRKIALTEGRTGESL